MSTPGLDRVVPETVTATKPGAFSHLDLTAFPDGNTAVYPGQGPCRLGRVVKKLVDGRVMLFYHLTLLGNKGGELFVPVDKAGNLGIRPLMKRSEIPQVMSHLKKRAKPAETWKQRNADNLRLLYSGSPYDLAEVVASLSHLRDTKALSLSEARTLDKARKLLVLEISEASGITEVTTEEQVDYALNSE